MLSARSQQGLLPLVADLLGLGLLLGLAAGRQRQPRCGLLQGARAWTARWRHADRLRRDCHTDRLHDREPARRRLLEPGRRVWPRLPAAGQGPFVFQVPDFGKRFWVYALYDARTDEFSELGQQYGTKPGFYLVVGPNWKGETPAGINGVVRSSTNLVSTIPRVFMDDTAEDRQAIQPVLSQIDAYPLSQFDGKMKTKDWSKLPHFPAPKSTGPGETKWVNPETYFDELPAVMKQVPPLPGEESLYRWISSVLEAAEKDPAVMQALKDTAVASEAMITQYLQWRYNGRAAGNGWNSQVNNAQWGTDYLNRTATSKSNIYENRPEETKYIYTDDDSQGQQLDGHNSYTITFPKGQTPPVKGFWSMTLYNAEHFYHDNPLKRYHWEPRTRTSSSTRTVH